jgi:hypothetical protein
VQSLYKRCAIALKALCNCIAIALKVLCNRIDCAVQAITKRFLIANLLLRGHFTIALESLRIPLHHPTHLHSTHHPNYSGGIGPTHDDVTITAIAKALGQEMVVNEELVTYLTKLYESRRPPSSPALTEEGFATQQKEIRYWAFLISFLLLLDGGGSVLLQLV